MPSLWRQINGVLLFDKPLELSSNSAMQKVRRIFCAEKAGHTGTLDPLATGLLPVCLGEATKFSMGLLDSDKTYIANIKLGVTTSTGDAEGEVLSQLPVKIAESDLKSILEGFKGEILQIPPMHSALKFKGKPLYEYIRNGETIERQPRSITVYYLHIIEFINDSLIIEVCCSKGTYIRTLAEDIGTKLGCGAHLSGLRRIGTGPFKLDNSFTIAQLERMSDQAREGVLLPVDSMLLNLRELNISQEQALRLAKGQRLGIDHHLSDGRIRLYAEGQFIGVGLLEGRRLAPERLISSLAKQAASKNVST